MRKSLLLVLSVLMLVALLASCNSTPATPPQVSSDVLQQTDDPSESNVTPIEPTPTPTEPTPSKPTPTPDAPITFSGATVEGKAGTTVTLPIKLQNNKGIAGYSISVFYPKDLLTFVSFESKVPGGFPTSNTTVDGKVRIMCAMAKNTLVQNDVIALVTFRIKDDAPVGTYPLTLKISDEKDTVYVLNENGKTEDIPVNFENGSVVISL